MQILRRLQPLTPGVIVPLVCLCATVNGASAQDVLSPDYGQPRAESNRASQQRVNSLRSPDRGLYRTVPRSRSAGYQSESVSQEAFGDSVYEEASDVFHDGHAGYPTNAEPLEQNAFAKHRASQPGIDIAVQPAMLEEPRAEARAAIRSAGTAAVAPASNVEPVEKTPPRPISLSPRRSRSSADADTADSASTQLSAPWGNLITVLASFGLVLGLFFAVAYVMRRGVPGTIPALPKGVIEVLGRVPLGGRQQMQLMRVGNKLILVHLSLAGAETLTEITDAAEVDRIAGLCLQSHSQSSSRAFHDMLDQIGRERTTPGFLEQDTGLELVRSSRSSSSRERGRNRRA